MLFVEKFTCGLVSVVNSTRLMYIKILDSPGEFSGWIGRGSVLTTL